MPFGPRPKAEPPPPTVPIVLPATFILADINPEPWMAPKFNPASKMTYAHPKMRAFKAAVREEFQRRYPNLEPIPKGTPLEIKFLYSRSTAKGRPADATNLTKATEDALQRHLFYNDTNNRRVTSVVMEQGPDTPRTGIVIKVQEYAPNEEDVALWTAEWEQVKPPEPARSWRDPDEEETF